MGKLGDQTQQALTPNLADYRPLIHQASTLIETGAGVERLARQTRAISDLISRPEVAVAIWRDLVEAAVEGQPLDECMLRVQQLREVSDQLGHPWTERAKELRSSVSHGDF